MPSTFTPSLKIELIGNGEQPTTWGITTNNNMGTLIEQSIAGVQPITLTGNTELTNFNGISDQARNAVLVFNGALSNTVSVVAPSVEKTYIVSNRSGANVTIKTSSGVGVTLANNVNELIYCDGSEFYTAVSPNDVIGNLSVSGNQTVSGFISIGGNITINNKITSNAGTLTLNSSTGVVDMATNGGAFTPPTGTDAERPSTPDLGMTRWNSTQGILEIWNGVQWQNITGNYAVEYLLVAGGGAGGGAGGNGGGGGAGGLLANSTTVSVGTSYTITVGAGGSAFAGQGANSSAFSITAIGGGGGGNNAGGGGNGGSGGGAARGSNNVPASGGTGTSGQGNPGGSTTGSTSPGYGSAGGGGASAVGQDGQPFRGGTGGAGSASSITGTSVTRAGGGGGAGGDGIGPGGAGGGGNGGVLIEFGQPTGIAGTANTGGGGGGSATGGASTNSGGSGIVILRYASASQRGTGGTVTSYSDAGITYFVHTFNSSGTFTA
jgi:hypothetical protein